MKSQARIFLLSLTAFLSFVFADKTYAQLEIGIKAGVNANSYVAKTADFRAEVSKYGLVGGAFIRLKIKSFSLEPQILYSQKNGQYSYSTLHKSFDSIFTGYSDYFDIPVLVGINLGKALKLHTGPVFSFLAREHLKFNTTGSPTSLDISENSFSHLNFGWQFGGNIEFGKLIFGVIYERSVQNTMKDFKFPNSNMTLRPDSRNSLWQFTLGYKFVKI